MKGIALLVLAAALLLAAACGDGGQENDLTPSASSSPAPGVSPTAAATRPPVASSAYCRPSQEPPASYNIDITAHWEGKDRLIIEGTADLPGPGSVNYLVCQDGEVSGSIRWARNPTFEDGKIRAESKVVEFPGGPQFDPDAHFDVILSILGDPVQIPYFTVSIPVEGKPG